MADEKNIFQKYTVPPEETKNINFGKVCIFMKRIDKGWFINEAEDKDGCKAEEGDFFQTGPSDSLIFAPALQEKPLVFNGGGKISVLPGQKLIFFLKIPLVLQIYHTQKKDETLLKEIPCEKLSNTWFGKPDKGEPAYAIGTEYALSQQEIESSGFHAICPVRVFNRNSKILDIQRLILHVENMSIYQNGDRFFTSLVKTDYKGKDTISSVAYSYAEAIHGRKRTLLARPRVDAGLLPARINFLFIKKIYNSI